jgi:hypothetical protein
MGRLRSVKQQRAVLPVESLGQPFVDHGFQLLVQRYVAVVVEFAERNPQPVGGSDWTTAS